MKFYIASLLVIVTSVACKEPPKGYFPSLCEKGAEFCPADLGDKYQNPDYVMLVKDISPPGVDRPWNPGIVRDGEGYLMTFRTDHFSANPGSLFQSHMGVARLDANFDFVPGSLSVITEGSRSRQDARIFRFGKKLHVIYSDLPPFEHLRAVFIAELSGSDGNWSLVNDGPFVKHPTRVDKNWSPFVYVDESNRQRFLLSYSASPHRVLEVFDARSQNFGDFSKCDTKLPWKWGGVRGGTPAVRIGDEYVSFFHSFFFDEVYKSRWYVFGAYTFEAKPPFCMKRISAEPIYFKEMFSAKHLQPSYVPGFTAFPVGLERTEYKGRNALVVSHCDSDATSRIAIFDEEKFLQTLIPVK